MALSVCVLNLNSMPILAFIAAFSFARKLREVNEQNAEIKRMIEADSYNSMAKPGAFLEWLSVPDPCKHRD